MVRHNGRIASHLPWAWVAGDIYLRHSAFMSVHASKRTLYAALAANAGIAIAKFCGAAYTGSSAMVSEGIHSLVDTGNQILLLYGIKDASRPADASHPFGYGLRLYFWGFVVAMAVFALGSGVAIYEGAEKVAHPTRIESAWVNILILVIAIGLEGSSLAVALREVRAEAARRGLGMLKTLQNHRDPTIFAVVYEETAALAGLLAALVGISLAVVLDMPVLDGWTSIAIGMILAVTALSLARRCYVLMTGQSADPAIEERLREILERVKVIEQVNEVRTMHFGPSEVLVLASADFVDDTLAGTVERIVSDVEDGMREEFPEVRRVYIEAQSTVRHREALEDIGEDVDALYRDAEAEENEYNLGIKR
ncbi:cation diffusion facilitator family transporter [Novosphingobium sp. ZW T3_23]|uniref:cation diffusion facilitator family transporter n=1 Tax=Novosphingobium sp. ZW T3_23 TaxID=3378084 RepID=UPI003854F0A5